MTRRSSTRFQVSSRSPRVRDDRSLSYHHVGFCGHLAFATSANKQEKHTECVYSVFAVAQLGICNVYFVAHAEAWT